MTIMYLLPVCPSVNAMDTRRPWTRLGCMDTTSVCGSICRSVTSVTRGLAVRVGGEIFVVLLAALAAPLVAAGGDPHRTDLAIGRQRVVAHAGVSRSSRSSSI